MKCERKLNELMFRNVEKCHTINNPAPSVLDTRVPHMLKRNFGMTLRNLLLSFLQRQQSFENTHEIAYMVNALKACNNNLCQKKPSPKRQFCLFWSFCLKKFLAVRFTLAKQYLSQK